MSCYLPQIKGRETALRPVCTAKDKGGNRGNLIREQVI